MYTQAPLGTSDVLAGVETEPSGGGVTDAERLAKITADIAGNYERWPNSAGSRLWLT